MDRIAGTHEDTRWERGKQDSHLSEETLGNGTRLQRSASTSLRKAPYHAVGAGDQSPHRTCTRFVQVELGNVRRIHTSASAILRNELGAVARYLRELVPEPAHVRKLHLFGPAKAAQLSNRFAPPLDDDGFPVLRVTNGTSPHDATV